jgi:hypothetical protein
MKAGIVDQIVNSVLYEGCMLYPYRRSALKNKHRWNFGLVYPRGVEPGSMTTECLVQNGGHVTIEVRFLQLVVDDSWQQPVERRIAALDCGTHPFRFGDLEGAIEITREAVQPNLEKIRIEISNGTTRLEDVDLLLQTLVSVHTILTVRDGEFVSLLDPPVEYREAAAACRNAGTWPVLVGRPPERDCMLSSPIILYDYPRVAPESPGDLFDATEIDEILTLRILTLTDGEKEEMRRSGDRERRILERVEGLTPEQLMRLHGVIRRPDSKFRRGDRVRLRPKPGGDVFDVVLSGRTAIVESVEQDFEDRTHIAVVVEDDPGKDLGLLRQPGHRFFFAEDEVELIA